MGLGAVVLSTLIGAVAGLLAAFKGGWVDTLVMRLVDFILGFPTILVALVLLAVMGRGVDKVVMMYRRNLGHIQERKKAEKEAREEAEAE